MLMLNVGFSYHCPRLVRKRPFNIYWRLLFFLCVFCIFFSFVFCFLFFLGGWGCKNRFSCKTNLISCFGMSPPLLVFQVQFLIYWWVRGYTGSGTLDSVYVKPRPMLIWFWKTCPMRFYQNEQNICVGTEVTISRRIQIF